MWIYMLTALVAAMAGFGAGFTTFNRSQRWCPECGEQITREHCLRPRSVASTPSDTTRTNRLRAIGSVAVGEQPSVPDSPAGVRQCEVAVADLGRRVSP